MKRTSSESQRRHRKFSQTYFCKHLLTLCLWILARDLLLKLSSQGAPRTSKPGGNLSSPQLAALWTELSRKRGSEPRTAPVAVKCGHFSTTGSTNKGDGFRTSDSAPAPRKTLSGFPNTCCSSLYFAFARFPYSLPGFLPYTPRIPGVPLRQWEHGSFCFSALSPTNLVLGLSFRLV